MKTMEIMKQMVMENREQYFAELRTMESGIKALEKAYDADGTPAETVDKFVKAVGYETAVSVIATLINREAWDGRIDKKNSAWAGTIESAYDAEFAAERCFYTRIHKAHLNQIATAIQKYEPEQEETEQEETEQAGNQEPEQEERKEETEMKKATNNDEFSAYMKAIAKLAFGYVPEIRCKFAAAALKNYENETIRALVLQYGIEIEKLESDFQREFMYAAKYAGENSGYTLKDSCLNKADHFAATIKFLFGI